MFFVNDVNVEKKEAKIAGCGKIAGRGLRTPLCGLAVPAILSKQ